MSPPQLGRQDESAPLLSWRARTTATMWALGLLALLAWHVAVALTSSTVGLTQVNVTSRALLRGQPLSGLGGPAPSTGATLAVFAGLLVAALAAVIGASAWWVSRRARGRRGRGFAGAHEVRDRLGVAKARASAGQTRPGLLPEDVKRAKVHQIGLPLGHVGREAVVLPLEDHLVVVAPTGAGKSRDVMIPAACSAPGALVITCTRADILDVVAEGRAQLGKLWVFDPLDRVGWPEPMVWNPVAGCRDGSIAIGRGLAFAAGLGADDRSATNSGFFRANASSALTRLLHAAALEDRPIADVIDWALHLDNGADIPQDIIRRSDDPSSEPMWAGMLRSVATGADETVASSRQTLQQAIEPLALRRVLRWVTPTPGVPAFDPAAFVRSSDTLVLVADDNASTNVAPLCAMLLQEVVDATKAAAARMPGGRLDPPLRLVGDEIANVAPLPRLPDLGTDARGFGMQLVLALQSLSQAERRWSPAGANTLLDTMPAELLFGGLTDVKALQRYSALVGNVELTQASTTLDNAGRATSTAERTAERTVLRTDEARRIPDRHGLLIYRNAPAVLLRMTPWFEGPDGRELEQARRRTEQRRLISR